MCANNTLPHLLGYDLKLWYDTTHYHFFGGLIIVEVWKWWRIRIWWSTRYKSSDSWWQKKLWVFICGYNLYGVVFPYFHVGCIKESVFTNKLINWSNTFSGTMCVNTLIPVTYKACVPRFPPLSETSNINKNIM